MARILMIDDDADLLMLTKRLLQRRGFEMEVASVEDDAMDKIRTFNPNLVLLDLFLDNADGLQICNKLKTSAFTRHIPVLILSGYPRFAESAINEFGADGFIAKPFKLDEMVSTLKHFISRNHQSA